jgi:tRNA A-37 threonylcarbamoyl transferase component Bud32
VSPIHPGQVVADRFLIERVADSGGMGVVYKARDRRDARDVALKVLLDKDSAPADRFAHEVELLSTLEHPHIVGYVSHGLTDDAAPFLVMPWLEGVDLEQRLRDGPLSIEDTLTLARGVADALAYLHGKGLVHRDLKPSNLFLPAGRFEDVQVIDLGVARPSIAARALTLSGTLIGTPGFIAPEQARGDHEIAPAVDIFAFGCVLFECLTGRRLFSGAHLMSVLAKILLEDAPRVRELRPDAPSELDLLVYRMVSKEPQRRPKDGAQLAKWLAELDRTAPPSSRPPPSHALGADERRVVSVLVVVLPATRVTARPRGDETRVEADPFRSAAARFGVRAQLLAERMAIVLAPEGVSAADQASVLARFAAHVAEMFPGAIVALTTGSALTGSSLPSGEAIDRAVTMVRAANAADGVLVDEVTAALITARFDIRRERERLVVEGERLSLDPTRPLLGRPTSCVGRERELAILESTAAECEAGDGPKVVLVTAGAGAGKSRLRHELVRRLGLRSEPPAVLVCRGDPLHLATPYAMIAQAVRHAADLREREPLEKVREKLRGHVSARVPAGDATRVNDFLGELVGATFDDRGRLPLRAARLDAAAMTDQVSRAFEDILRAWCEHRPVVLVLEDLHWGDAATVKLLDRALRKLEGARLFVLALARPEVHARFTALFAHRDVTEIRLPPLPRRACAKLVHEVMGERHPPDDVGRIVERSEGNGFYLEELIRAAVERKGRASVPPPPSHLPPSVLAVAQARLERLEPEARRVLRAASVFGDVFWLEGVSALVGQSTSALEPIVATLLENEAIASSEPVRRAGWRELVFRHTLLHDTAYATLTDEDRALGHKLAAQWLEDVGEDGEVVALHWLEAGDRARAAASFFRAGEARWARAQADAAARCATRALLVGDAASEAAITIEPRVRLLAAALEATRSLDVRDVLTGLERHLGVDPRAPPASRTLVVHALDRALAPLRARDADPTVPAILVHAACAVGALADFGVAKRLLAEATERAGEDAPQRRAVTYASAKVAFWGNDAVTAVELLADTLLPEDPRLRLEMLLILAWGVVMVDGHEALARGLDFVSRAEAIRTARTSGDRPAESHDDPVSQVHCAKARFFCFYLAGEYAKAAEAAEAAVAIARGAGLRFDECAHMHNAGEMYLRLGEADRARALLTASNDIAHDIGAERNARHNDVLLAYLDADAARLAADSAAARAAGDTWIELFARFWLAQLLASVRARGAAVALEEALALAEQLKFRTMAEDCARTLSLLGASPVRS